MNKDFFLQLINSQKYLPLRFGFVIATIHFLISLFIIFVINPRPGGIMFLAYLLLSAPSYLLLIENFMFFNSELLMWLFSSLIYGILAGMLASEKMQWVGFILIALLILSFLFIVMWIVMLY
ncbi:MAG: hypothetical protein JNM46_03480 [Anaerolineales bacterium]|nr:hypothetical protein [Anaerolineales bacterium]